jgi:hypothetical protein
MRFRVFTRNRAGTVLKQTVELEELGVSIAPGQWEYHGSFRGTKDEAPIIARVIENVRRYGFTRYVVATTLDDVLKAWARLVSMVIFGCIMSIHDCL